MDVRSAEFTNNLALVKREAQAAAGEPGAATAAVETEIAIAEAAAQAAAGTRKAWEPSR